MKKRRPRPISTYVHDPNMAEDFRVVARKILRYANRGLPLIDFLREISKMLIEFSQCDEIEMRFKKGAKYYHCKAKGPPEFSFRLENMPSVQNEEGKGIPCSEDESGVERLCRTIFAKGINTSLPFFSKSGSFWIGDIKNPLLLNSDAEIEYRISNFSTGEDHNSLAMIPLEVKSDSPGLLILKSKQKFFFTAKEIDFYESLAQNLVLAIAHQHAQSELCERIKELTCLYDIAKIVEQPEISTEDILQGIVEILPPAWQYPEIASAQIIFDNSSFTTSGFKVGKHTQMADILISGEKRGVIEVSYAEDKPELDEGPFLKEERNLIDTVAREVALITERRQVQEERLRLREQLRHADRLATLGQLASGVAHELNEPLANILGFAQLSQKYNGTPKQVKNDLEKIIKASLHAREVVKKLLIFARQMPTKMATINLNKIVEEGLYFLESRCEKEGIDLERSLSPELSEVVADPAQLHQVLVNLVVNAIQAMPDGGRLKVTTSTTENHISLIVEDTGVGMSKKIIDKIFLPFFTTKDIGEGTGLGLPVVHGIVTLHGGTIEVKSEVGHGSTFEVRLPIAKSKKNKEKE
ncbi:hypothetical protein KAW18_09005 [candidate division WOR-3 bacterium]|nr:hypothetical protein [candidate division WOR-3 bacterium]MCK4527494.1 hypothetical protein [candidate division WOR-3 bacterium]